MSPTGDQFLISLRVVILIRLRNGVKVMKFNLTGDQWLDPSTFRVAFQLYNHNGNISSTPSFPIMVQPLSWNPAVFFRRARLICGGQVIEDIDDFNLLSPTLTDLMPEDDQNDIACEGFGNFDFVKDEEAQASDDRKGYRQDDYDLSGNVNLSRRVMFTPMLGLFNQGKLTPLRYCPIQIELELVNSQADAVTIEPTNGFSNGSNWDISDVQCKCDLLELDSSLSNEYASHLLSGKSLPINFNTWNHTNQSTGLDKQFSVHITRAMTRVKSIFITLHKPDNVTYKQVNGFYHPCTINGQLNIANENFISSSDWFLSILLILCQNPIASLRKLLGDLSKCILHGIALVSILLVLTSKKSVEQDLLAWVLKQAIYSL